MQPNNRFEPVGRSHVSFRGGAYQIPDRNLSNFEFLHKWDLEKFQYLKSQIYSKFDFSIIILKPNHIICFKFISLINLHLQN